MNPAKLITGYVNICLVAKLNIANPGKSLEILSDLNYAVSITAIGFISVWNVNTNSAK